MISNTETLDTRHWQPLSPVGDMAKIQLSANGITLDSLKGTKSRS